MMQYGLNEVKTKLTAITIEANGLKYQGFHVCEVLPNGKTILDGITLTNIFRRLNVKLGDDFSIG